MTPRRALRLAAAALAASALGLLLFASVSGARRFSDDPVRLTVKAPAKVALKKRFALSVKVDADAGALDIAAQPLRLHVLFEPECGGSFEGSTGKKVIDRPLPAPATGTAYSFTAKNRSSMKNFKAQTLCVYVSDAEQRQYVTSTNVTVAATKSCTRSTKALVHVKKAVKKAKGRRKVKLRSKLHKAGKRKAKACPKPVSSDG